MAALLNRRTIARNVAKASLRVHKTCISEATARCIGYRSLKLSPSLVGTVSMRRLLQCGPLVLGSCVLLSTKKYSLAHAAQIADLCDMHISLILHPRRLGSAVPPPWHPLTNLGRDMAQKKLWTALQSARNVEPRRKTSLEKAAEVRSCTQGP